MQSLLTVSENSSEYPCNLIYPSLPQYHLRLLLSRLDKDQCRLFGPSTEASVNFWELDVDGKGERIYVNAYRATSPRRR